MDIFVYAVFDSKAEAFGTPMFLLTKGMALRGFSDACADPASPMAKHPEDYVLHQIGTYEQNSGKLSPLPQPLFVVAASSICSLLRPEPGSAAPVQPALPMNRPPAPMPDRVNGGRK